MILEQEMLSTQCVTHFLNQIYDTRTGNVIHTMCYSLSQPDLWYWNRKCYPHNVLLTFLTRSMILEQEMLSTQCVTHFLNQIYDTRTGNIIGPHNVLLTFSTRSMILEQEMLSTQCVTHFLNQIYDTRTGNVIHTMCYSLSQPDLWYWNRKCYPHNVLLTFLTRSMILEQEMLSTQCVTHFLNQIYDTRTGNIIHTMCYSLSQWDLWY